MDNKIFQEIDQLHSESKMDNASMSLGSVTSGENLMRIESVGDTVKRIASSYVYYFNRKYGRDGLLFKERFKSEPVNDMAYFTVLLRYIHQNPVKAGIVEKVKDYEFSSWGEYDGTVEPVFQICDTQTVLNRIPYKELDEPTPNREES